MNWWISVEQFLVFIVPFFFCSNYLPYRHTFNVSCFHQRVIKLPSSTIIDAIMHLFTRLNNLLFSKMLPTASDSLNGTQFQRKRKFRREQNKSPRSFQRGRKETPERGKGPSRHPHRKKNKGRWKAQRANRNGRKDKQTDERASERTNERAAHQEKRSTRTFSKFDRL